MPDALRTAAILLVVALCAWVAPATAAQAGETFELRDFLGRQWRNESVRFPLSPRQNESVQSRRALVGPDNRAVAYQLAAGTPASTPAIEFLADLDPYETRTYRFINAPAPAAGDLRVEETADVIRLGNSRIGISIRKRLAPGQGPIERIRFPSGKSLGDSQLKTAQRVSSYSARVLARGPVYSEVLCRVELANGSAWEMRLRLQAYEPVVLVDETFAAGDASAFVLLLNRDFSAEHLLYRHGKGAVGRLATSRVAGGGEGPVFVLEPWLHWWERERQGTWFGVYDEREPHLVAVGAREAAAWIDPAQKPNTRKLARLPLTFERGELSLTLLLTGGARKWMIGAFDREASLAPLREKEPRVAPLPQQYFIKHGAFPLNRIKDYVLRWSGDETDHPRLMVKQADVAAWRAASGGAQGRAVPLPKTEITEHRMDEPIAAYLRTGDRDLGRLLTETAVKSMQRAVDGYLKQDALVSLGYAPHHQSALLTAVNLADAVWSSEHMSPELRERLKAQVAFLAYTVNRPDYWSPERGFSANPNMTSTVAAFQSILGCMIPAHPMARGWIDNGMRELKRQLDGWADEDGGWLEAPHYAVVSYDHLLGAFLAAHNAGFNDYLFDPKMKKVAEWLAKISTPPDALSHGRRHLAPIGNTYMREPSGLFGIVAALWKDKDPVFASEMKWMHKQHGAPAAPGVGGFFPTLAGYRTVLGGLDIPKKAPAYRSERFQRTGVMLRSHFPSARETQLHLIAGANHAHYDRDSGSYTLWGKGRIVANDFGYYGHAPGEDHNMVTAERAPDGALMNITHFIPGDQVDYVRGVKNGAWERKIAFVKHPDPLGPAYFVFADTVKESSATWRTWFTARAVTPEGQGALVQGAEDVDTDVFISGSAGSSKTEAISRQTWGMSAGKDARVSTTQTALIVPMEAGSALVTVLYPRLKTQKRVVFTSIAQGYGVKVETDASTDYIFMGKKPLSFREGTLIFEGTVGAVLIRGAEPTLWLGEPGTIRSQGRTLKLDRIPGLAGPE